ncbi:MAG: hypothetical protein GDA50_04205 [Alphaproteobacteria bacterium GM202ARS2]|nr:hypothetical protein [Alphaproteobacteria bacterium GM202ARS2]
MQFDPRQNRFEDRTVKIERCNEKFWVRDIKMFSAVFDGFAGVVDNDLDDNNDFARGDIVVFQGCEVRKVSVQAPKLVHA